VFDVKLITGIIMSTETKQKVYNALKTKYGLFSKVAFQRYFYVHPQVFGAKSFDEFSGDAPCNGDIVV
jgi:hypothetical protein